MFISGCSSLPLVRIQKDASFPQIINWNPSSPEPNGAEAWLRLAQKRWVNPIIFLCHGGDGPDGEWYVFPDKPRTKMPAEDVAQALHNIYPEHDIIFICCNEGQHNLYTPNVWYARSYVWSTPDPDVWHKLFPKYNEHTMVGSIWDFVTYDGRKSQATTLPR